MARVLPLSERVPITDSAGLATPYFTRQWQSLNNAGGGDTLPSQTGNAGKVLSTDGNVLSWITVGGSGTVTSVSGAGTVNGLTLTGTVTTTGNLTLGGTLSGIDLATQTTGNLAISRGGVPTGGTTGQALVKVSGTDYDVAWATGTVASEAISWAI